MVWDKWQEFVRIEFMRAQGNAFLNEGSHVPLKFVVVTLPWCEHVISGWDSWENLSDPKSSLGVPHPLPNLFAVGFGVSLEVSREVLR